MPFPVVRAFGVHAWVALLAAVVALAALPSVGRDAATQEMPASGLIAADPEPNALLTAAPNRIALTFAEPVEAASASVRLLQAGGIDVPLGPVQSDAAAPERLLVQPQTALGAGEYTVVWSARADDGALLAGAYPFRAGGVGNPGVATVVGEWPAAWATVLRWTVFLGTALAAGGFAWQRLLAPGPGARAREGFARSAVMACGALAALLATALAPLIEQWLRWPGGPAPSLAGILRGMPPAWWVQFVALCVLALLSVGLLVSRRPVARLPETLDWTGIGAGLAALVGLGLTGHAGATADDSAMAVEIVHLWTAALWLSGLLYLLGGWRGLGSDVARFRRVRWIGGLLVALAVASGGIAALRVFSSLGEVVTSRYGLVLIGKSVLILAILALGVLTMIVPRRSTAARASRSLGTQAALAMVAALLSALLALMALPGMMATASLAGVELADVVPVDPAALGADSATIHLLAQPLTPGAQTIVVRLADADGAPLAANPAPEVDIAWTAFSGPDQDAPVETSTLQPDDAGVLFTGAATLAAPGWWQADVVVTPPDGVASRAHFWLVLPDPNVTGHGPDPETDPEAQALFERGLEALTSLRSVRSTQRLGDGGGSLSRTRVAVSAAEGERPAAFTDTVVDGRDNTVARQTIVGNRRWVLVDGDWAEAEPTPFLTPAGWGESYAGAAGFQLGPRESLDGELCQVVTFWRAPRGFPSREPAWFAWWVGLASGEVRQEVMISTRHYMVNRFSDFNAELGISAPVAPQTPAGTATPASTPVATPPASEELKIRPPGRET